MNAHTQPKKKKEPTPTYIGQTDKQQQGGSEGGRKSTQVTSASQQARIWNVRDCQGHLTGAHQKPRDQSRPGAERYHLQQGDREGT